MLTSGMIIQSIVTWYRARNISKTKLNSLISGVAFYLGCQNITWFICILNIFLSVIHIIKYILLSHLVLSKALWLLGLWTARLLCRWNSPSKNSGVGYHFPPPGDLPNPGIEFKSPALQADSLPAEPCII